MDLGLGIFCIEEGVPVSSFLQSSNVPSARVPSEVSPVVVRSGPEEQTKYLLTTQDESW